MQREQTRTFKVGLHQFGGNNKVYIQSMTNTYTKDVESTVAQIKKLEAA
ncbi:MAG: 4-hydroxy-3-methylbut-2-en-1-yl diphosphate synthase, partial [Tenericutes bacterium HGW-Tenericutes-3]